MKATYVDPVEATIIDARRNDPPVEKGGSPVDVKLSAWYSPAALTTDFAAEPRASAPEGSLCYDLQAGALKVKGSAAWETITSA